MTTPPTGGPGPGWSVPGAGPPAPGAPARAPAPSAARRARHPRRAAARGAAGGPGPAGLGPDDRARRRSPTAASSPAAGIIALKPLGFGDFFDGSFRAIRHNPRVMIGLSALVLVVTNILVALPLVGAGHRRRPVRPDGRPERRADRRAAGRHRAAACSPSSRRASSRPSRSRPDRHAHPVGHPERRGPPAGRPRELWQRARGRVLAARRVVAAAVGRGRPAASRSPWPRASSCSCSRSSSAGRSPSVVLLPRPCSCCSPGSTCVLVFVPVVIVVERLGVVAAVRRSVRPRARGVLADAASSCSSPWSCQRRRPAAGHAVQRRSARWG